MSRYIELIEANRTSIVERVELNENEIRSEALFLGLRMMRGVNLDDYQSRFGSDIHDSHESDLKRFREAGLIEYEGNVMRLTQAGALLSNEVFSAFI